VPLIDIDGVRIHFVQLEGPSANNPEDLVMVHGLGTSLSFWYSPHAANFSARYRVTLFDLPGHGRSDAPASGYTPRELARCLLNLLDALGIRRTRVVAHSFGGVIALGAALLEPQRMIDLVVADTQVYAQRGGGKEPTETSSRIQELLRHHGIELDAAEHHFGFKLLGAVAKLRVQGGDVAPELVQLLGPLLGQNSRRTAERWLELLERSRAEEELMSDDELTPDRLKRIDLPVLAVYGERSRNLAAGRSLSALLPRASFEQVPGAGHFFPATRATDFQTACEQFWERCSAPARCP
jgi:pimeloyl-ACP methyl ester carboxylesterase